MRKSLTTTLLLAASLMSSTLSHAQRPYIPDEPSQYYGQNQGQSQNPYQNQYQYQGQNQYQNQSQYQSQNQYQGQNQYQNGDATLKQLRSIIAEERAPQGRTTQSRGDDLYMQSQQQTYAQPQTQVQPYSQQTYNQTQAQVQTPSRDSYSTSQGRTTQSRGDDLYMQSQQQTYTQPQTQYQTYSQPQTQSYSQPQAQSYSQPQAQSYSQPQTQSYSQPQQQTYSQPQNYNQPQAQIQSPSRDSYNNSVNSSYNSYNNFYNSQSSGASNQGQRQKKVVTHTIDSPQFYHSDESNRPSQYSSQNSYQNNNSTATGSYSNSNTAGYYQNSNTATGNYSNSNQPYNNSASYSAPAQTSRTNNSIPPNVVVYPKIRATVGSDIIVEPAQAVRNDQTPQWNPPQQQGQYMDQPSVYPGSNTYPYGYGDGQGAYMQNQRANDKPRVSELYTIVDGDTVSVILPQKNLGRFDRGLYNYLYIPKGRWAFGLTASYGEFSTEDVQLLNILKDFDVKGKLYSIKPFITYFFRHNQSMGLRLNYTRGEADLSSMVFDFDDDMSFDLKDVSYYYEGYSMSAFYRNYVGLGRNSRFSVFNDIDLAFSSGSSRFKRYYDQVTRDTQTTSMGVALNFSPGVCVFIMDNAAFNVSFGVFGVSMHKDKQVTDGVEEGSRFSSGANFKFNLFNINFGLMIVI